MTAHVLSFPASKGGVGKTSLATNIACSLALGTRPTTRRMKKTAGGEGRKVLVVDLDRQRSAGDSLGVRGVADGNTLLAALAGDSIDLGDATFTAPVDAGSGRVDVMPTTPLDYERAVATLPRYPDSGLQMLKMALEPVMTEYDYIVLDLRPELSNLVSAAICASVDGGALMPVTSEMTTAVHLGEVIDHIDWVREASGVDVRTLGIVRSIWTQSYEATQVSSLIERFNSHVFHAIIPNHRQVSKSFLLSSGPCVLSYPKAAATKKFHELTAEIVARVEA